MPDDKGPGRGGKLKTGWFGGIDRTGAVTGVRSGDRRGRGIRRRSPGQGGVRRGRLRHRPRRPARCAGHQPDRHRRDHGGV